MMMRDGVVELVLVVTSPFRLPASFPIKQTYRDVKLETVQCTLQQGSRGAVWPVAHSISGHQSCLFFFFQHSSSEACRLANGICTFHFI